MRLYGFYNMTAAVPGMLYPLFVEEDELYVQDGTGLCIQAFTPVPETLLHESALTLANEARCPAPKPCTNACVGDDTILALHDCTRGVIYGPYPYILPLLFPYTMQRGHAAASIADTWNRFFSLHNRSFMEDKLASTQSHTSSTAEEALVCEILRNIGVSVKTLGFSCLRDAVLMVVDTPALAGKIESIIYPELARRHGLKAQQVSNAISNAVQLAYGREDNEHLQFYLGHYGRQRPSSSRCITGIAAHVRLTQKRRA